MLIRYSLLVGSLLLGLINLHAQHIVVTAQDSTHLQDSLREVVSMAQKSELQFRALSSSASQNVFRLRDSIEQVSAKKPKSIYSEKKLDSVRDSLKALYGSIPVIGLKVKEISKEDMLGQVNEKFPSFPEVKADVPQTDTQFFKQTAQDSLKQMQSQQIGEINDLKSVKLPSEDLADLSPLPASLTKKKYLKNLDSIRNLNLKDEKMRLREKKISAQSKVNEISEKPSFLERTYFEGILGFVSQKDFTLFQASPSLGFHFTDYFSIGAGPTYQLQTGNKKLVNQLGMRSFIKGEFLKRQFYLQVEDAINPSRSNREAGSMDVHNILVGGGGLLSLNAPVTLNVSLMYNVKGASSEMGDLSPFVMRIGISTVKLKK